MADKILRRMNKPQVKDVDIESADFNAGEGSRESENENSDSDDDEKNAQELAKRSHYVATDKSKIKRTTINLGEKYVGAKVNRAELFDMEESKDDVSDASDASDILGDVTDSEAEEGESEQEGNDDGEVSGQEYQSDDEQDELQSEVQSESQDEDEDEAFKRSQITRLIQEEKEQVLSRASNTAKVDALKGYTILKQGSQFDKILDTRIKLQKAMVSGNSLPIDAQTLAQFQTERTPQLVQEVNDKLLELISKLTRARGIALSAITKEEAPAPKKRKLSSMLRANAKMDELETPLRKAVLSKWSNRVQAASGMGALNQNKFKVLNQSIWTQVSNELGDIDRLVKKTKVNRRGVKPLGYQQETNVAEDDEDETESATASGLASLSNIDKSLELNEHIFDDDDFYRMLLNDMINKKLDQKQANSQAILMLSKNKLQKNYDRMATKGRKLKYTVQDSLVQFEMPKRERFVWDDDQIDELFAGLMGMKVQMGESDEEADVDSDVEHEDLSTFKDSGVKLFG